VNLDLQEPDKCNTSANETAALECGPCLTGMYIHAFLLCRAYYIISYSTWWNKYLIHELL